MGYHLEKIVKGPCTSAKLEIFGRAHYSYINQIFGDLTVRSIIKEVMKKPGKLVAEVSGEDFENSFHHVFKAGRTKASKVCSVDERYQDITVDINDNLCQSYSLMSYLQIPFDTTESRDATVKQKHSKHMAMITMYRMILRNEKFVKMFSDEIVFEENNELWEDTIDHTNTFNIIEHYKSGPAIIEIVENVLNVWEKYGWMYFVGDGICLSQPKGGSKKTRRNR